MLFEEKEQRWVQMMFELLGGIDWKGTFLNKRLHSCQYLSVIFLHQETRFISGLISDNLMNMLKCNLRLVSIIGRHSLENGFEDLLLDNPLDLGFNFHHKAIVIKHCQCGTKGSLNQLARGRLICHINNGRMG